MNENWIGKIRDDDRSLKQMRSAGIHLMGSSIIPIFFFFIFSLIIGLDFTLLLIMMMFSIILFSLGFLSYTRKSYGISYRIFITGKQKKYWLDKGNLKMKLIDLLDKGNVKFKMKDHFFFKIYIELPEDLKIWVQLIRSRSKKLFESEYILSIDLVGINLKNTKKAKEIKSIMNGINIKSLYSFDESEEDESDLPAHLTY